MKMINRFVTGRFYASTKSSICFKTIITFSFRSPSPFSSVKGCMTTDFLDIFLLPDDGSMVTDFLELFLLPVGGGMVTDILEVFLLPVGDCITTDCSGVSLLSLAGSMTTDFRALCGFQTSDWISFSSMMTAADMTYASYPQTKHQIASKVDSQPVALLCPPQMALLYCQTSNKRCTKSPKLKCFSSCLAAVFAQSIEARC